MAEMDPGARESQGTRPSSRWRKALGFSLVIGLVLWVALDLLGPRDSARSLFTSCRVHATFVRFALHSQLEVHGQLPFVRDLPGEELFCRIDFNGRLEAFGGNIDCFGENCHAGAPGQEHGGWQMVNADAATWAELLAAPRDDPLPVLWCGRTHRVGGVDQRIVIAIPAKVTRLEQLGLGGDGQLLDIVYGMPEPELRARLAAMNAVLAHHGLPPTPIDVEGRPGYADLAAPYQSGDPR